MKKKFLLLICLFVITAFIGKAQSQKLSGVYGGAQLYTTPFDGMQINNIVFYFRDNGTFNNQLNKADWKTKVSGTYAIKNNMVQLTFQSGAESVKYKLDGNGNLESTAGIKHTLHKIKKVTALPAASYERKTASSSGGMGTGMPNVAAFSSGYLYFDGKGNFSFNRSGIVGMGGDVAGGTIGGKYEKNDKTSGTYKLGDGEITLTFKNGTATKHSFFYSPPNEEDLILLDGEFYFREEGQKSETEQPVVNNTKEEANSTVEGSLPTPAALLNKLRVHYGGEHIDKLTTIKETSTITGDLQAVLLTDIAHNKVRVEIRQHGKLLLVKQLEGNQGWQWVKGASKPLSPDEKSELQLSLYQGVLGLHKKLNNYFLTGTVSRSGDDYMLSFFMNKHKLVYLIGSDYALKGNAYAINEVPNFSVYKNFIQTDGITYPYITESSDGKTTITANISSIEFNPVLTDDNWKAM